MANALISVPSVGGTPVTLPLFDPRMERDNRRRFRRDFIPELELANAFYMPSGRWPARGWLLLRRADYDQINPYGTFQLQIDDFINPKLTFSNLIIVQARCVSTGILSDKDAIFLVEITDRRGLLWNPWWTALTTSQFNVRAPAYPELFYTGSMNAGTAYTWDQMAESLWNQMGGNLFTYPNFPIPPTDTPEGWIFPGCSGWKALNDVIEYQGCSITVDLTNATAPYDIVEWGVDDPAFTFLQTIHLGKKEEDLDWIDVGSGRVPGQMVVLFHRRNAYYGTEETIRRDGFQWQSTPSYSVTVTSPGEFVNGLGIGYLWSQFTVRYDVDNNPLAADVATATAIATQEVTNYFQRTYRATLGYMRQIYAGALPFVTGSQVDGVLWRMDFPEGKRFGWRTEIIRGPSPPWPEVAVHEYR